MLDLVERERESEETMGKMSDPEVIQKIWDKTWQLTLILVSQWDGKEPAMCLLNMPDHCEIQC